MLYNSLQYYYGLGRLPNRKISLLLDYEEEVESEKK